MIVLPQFQSEITPKIERTENESQETAIWETINSTKLGISACEDSAHPSFPQSVALGRKTSDLTLPPGPLIPGPFGLPATKKAIKVSINLTKIFSPIIMQPE